MCFARQTILLVEDDANDTALLHRAFDRFSLLKSIRVVSTGEQAISYLDGHGKFSNRDEHPLPTLIFLDLKLPGMSGFEVLTWIRQQGRFDKTQIVVLTGSKKGLDVYRAYELGANSYLVKPVNAEDIAGLAQSLNLPWLTLADSKTATVTPVTNAFDRAVPG